MMENGVHRYLNHDHKGKAEEKKKKVMEQVLQDKMAVVFLRIQKVKVIVRDSYS